MRQRLLDVKKVQIFPALLLIAPIVRSFCPHFTVKLQLDSTFHHLWVFLASINDCSTRSTRSDLLTPQPTAFESPVQ